jgi:hypothetical protein
MRTLTCWADCPPCRAPFTTKLFNCVTYAMCKVLSKFVLKNKCQIWSLTPKSVDRPGFACKYCHIFGARSSAEWRKDYPSFSLLTVLLMGWREELIGRNRFLDPFVAAQRLALHPAIWKCATIHNKQYSHHSNMTIVWGDKNTFHESL